MTVGRNHLLIYNRIRDRREQLRCITNLYGCCLTQHILRNMNQLMMSRGRIGKISTFPGGNETIVRNICSYQVPAMVGTNASTNKKHKFYNSTLQAISRGGGDCAKKVGSLYAFFLILVPRLKPRWKMGSVSSLTYGDRPLICITKPFLS